jgi:hypothetical protein
MTTATRLPWVPVQHSARVPIVVCWRCGARELNEQNRLHRGGWQEVRWGRGYQFRCGDCAREQGDSNG